MTFLVAASLAGAASLTSGIQYPGLAILLLGLIALWFPSARSTLRDNGWGGVDLAVITALCAIPIATIITMAVHPGWLWAELDNPSRYFAAAMVYVMVRLARPLKEALWIGLAIGCVGAFFHAVTTDGRAGAYINVISFGMVSMGLAVFAIVVAIFDQRRLVQLVLLLSAIGGVYAALDSGTRGSWIALLGLLVILPLLLPRQILKRYLLISLVIGLGVYFASQTIPSVSQRGASAVEGLKCWVLEDRICEGSVGVRLETAKSGLVFIHEAPFFGFGMSPAQELTKRALAEGLVDPALPVFDHFHNDMVETLMAQGIVGLGLYLGHVCFFLYLGWNSIARNAGSDIIEFAALLIVGIIAQLSFGLSHALMVHASSAAFFAISIAIMAGYLMNARYRQSPPKKVIADIHDS